MMAATRNQRVVQSGSPTEGASCEMPCASAHTAAAYTAPARNTLRRLSFPKNVPAFKRAPWIGAVTPAAVQCVTLPLPAQARRHMRCASPEYGKPGVYLRIMQLTRLQSGLLS